MSNKKKSSKSKIEKYSYENKAGKLIEVPNLYVDSITGIFYGRFYISGRTRTKSLKTKNFTTAKSRISAAKKELETGKKKNGEKKLIKDFYEDFYNSLITQDLSEATMTRYQVSWTHHIEPFWALQKPGEIDQEMFQRFVAWHKKNKGGTLFNHLKLLRGLFKMFEKKGLMKQKIEVTLPKTERDANLENKGTYITEREIVRILESAENEVLKLFIELSYSFGFRIGELANLKKSRIKSHGKVLVVDLRVQDTKTRKARKVPLNLRLSARLKDHMKQTTGAFVFPQKSGKKAIATQSIDKWWRQNLREAGIRRRLRFHDLRHTCATNFANLDISPLKACSVLGMSLKIFEDVYVKKNKLDYSAFHELDTLGELVE